MMNNQLTKEHVKRENKSWMKKKQPVRCIQDIYASVISDTSRLNIHEVNQNAFFKNEILVSSD
jgi:hypothetical protein